jgi:tetratricopeptide (TPR) repeat protein
VAICHHNIAALQRAQGHYAAAATEFRRALAIAEKVTGPTSPETAAALLGMGSLYTEAGRPAEAIESLRRVLAILEAR